MYDPTRSPVNALADRPMRELSPEELRQPVADSPPQAYALYPWQNTHLNQRSSNGVHEPVLATMRTPGQLQGRTGAPNGLDLISGAAARLDPNLFNSSNGASIPTFSSYGTGNHLIDPSLTGPSAENTNETRSVSQAMSISAMLSGPSPARDLDTPQHGEHIQGPAVMRTKRPYRKRQPGDPTSDKKRKKLNDSKKRKDGRNKSRIIPDVYDIEKALVDSEESASDEDDDISTAQADFQNRWHARCLKLTSSEAALQKKRRADSSLRILTMLDRRIRKSQKAFDTRYHDVAYRRATFEDGIRRQVEQHEALIQRTNAAKASTPMPPPATTTKKSKKRKRDTAVPNDLDDYELPSSSKRPSMSAEKQDAAHDAIWREIVKKEIPKVYRIIQSNNTNRTLNMKKTTQLCAKEARRWQFRTNKTSKDMQAKSKRAMREMLIFWKRNEKGDLLNRQKAERELIDKAKKEEESREARRQARKLNFLITQTELYSHFIGNKVKTAEAEQSEDTVSDARVAVPPPVIPTPQTNGSNADLDFDADDDDALQAAAARNAHEAVLAAKAKAQGFDHESGARPLTNGDAQANVDAMDLDFQNPTTLGEAEITQPKILNATLKEYQLKGLNWLVNLYEQGINGILADEMGLGKTVQSISVMAHLAETYNIWGPFLVIAPASTLHNWQQEISRFVPRLKALPYWGNSKDRKVLRKFWDRKRATYTEDAPFHVVVTSYQLVVQDAQYFQNVKWQYMILDEAQAIKSSTSSRWKHLLAFKCRNRLLLTGTPIQNTMQELWALLHFIMPSLFDSHNEFSEWFSKDIENHAQKNSELNETQLRRLHMILKPFMLRRVKKNVQKELGDKIELDVFCDLNMRQRQIYSVLRKEISMKDIIERATSDRDSDLSSLMNLVMQLRKVCNHPDLFERADVRAPLAMVDLPNAMSLQRDNRFAELDYLAVSSVKYYMPKLLYREGILHNVGPHTRAGFVQKYIGNLFSIYATDNINMSLHCRNSAFSWSSFFHLCPSDFERIAKNKRLPCSSQANVLSSITESPRALLQVLRRAEACVSSNNDRGPLAELTNIQASVVDKQRLSRIDPVFDPRAVAPLVEVLCPDRGFENEKINHVRAPDTRRALFGLTLPEESAVVTKNIKTDLTMSSTGIFPDTSLIKRGYGGIRMPSMSTFVTDSGKLAKLDELLVELKKNDHRVLLYFQMTRMIDLMEEYLVYRQYKYLRLDGSSKISDRRDMVNDWQTRPDLFIFLLSTRAGGLGINLTAADTVIFYDSDWNPTIDSQAMDRAHRLGQTKQVTVYRLITRGTIEERILSRAKQKEEVQKVVISGGDYRQGSNDNVTFQSAKGSGGRDVVSWLLEDDDQAKEVERRLESLPAQKNKVKSKDKGLQGPSLDDLYHEGEAEFERGTGLNSPEDNMSEFGGSVASLPKKKKKSLPNKKRNIEEL